MNALTTLLAALAMVGAEEYGFSIGERAPWALPLLLVVPYFLARATKRAVQRGRGRLAARCARLLTLSPLLLHAAALALCGWRESLSRLVEQPISIFAWPSPWILVLLGPYVCYAVAASDAEARLGSTTPAGRARLRRFSLSTLFALLVPIALYVLLCSLARLSPELLVRLETVALYQTLFPFAVLLSLTLLLPWVLARTRLLGRLSAGPQQQVVDAIARAAGFRSLGFRVWRTGNLMANAAIVGLTSWSRVVLFSDALLARLDPRELGAVAAHEIGHAQRHHIPSLLAWTVVCFGGIELLAIGVDPTLEGVGPWLLVGGLGLWFLVIGWISRRFELEADLYSLELTGDPLALRSALMRVSGPRREARGWRHFSTRRREGFLLQASVDPGLGRRFRARLRVIKWLGVLALAVVVPLYLRGLLSGLDTERVLVDLKRARYASAADRLAEAEAETEDLQPELVALVERGARVLGRDLDSPEEAADPLVQAALRALQAGSAEAALECLRLADLTGHHGAAAVGEGLELALAGEHERARLLVEPRSEEWWSAIEAAVRRGAGR